MAFNPSKLPSVVVDIKERILREALGVGVSYPIDLLTNGAENRALKIAVYDYNKGKIDESEKTLPLFSIYLPMPFELIDGSSFQYDQFGGLFNRVAENFKQGGVTGENVSSAGLDIALSSLAKLAGSDKAAVLREAGGINLNPRTSVFFSNPALKAYGFRFIMVPRNQAESEAVRTIINKLKYYASPGLIKGGNIFTHPQLFRLRFLPEDRYMFIPNDCVLEEINVSYNDQTQGAFYRDTGAPTEVSLQLTFREIEYDTKESIEKKYT